MKKIFNRLFSRKLPQNIQHLARRKLVILDAATELNALSIPPGNGLEASKGEREGNAAYESTTNGGYVSNGAMVIRMMLKLLIIIRRFI